MTYTYRLTPCPNEGCDDGKLCLVERNGFVAVTCPDCEGRAVVDASCSWCNRIVPLDDEGACADCMAPVEQFTEVHSDPFLKRKVA